jgi:hypothetical protein
MVVRGHRQQLETEVAGYALCPDVFLPRNLAA